MILANHGIVSSSGASFDADALAFITAASITDNTQKTAVNTLVTDLKTYNIWNKMKALYPFVGGSATSHKFNLKDPRDLDVAFRLVFNGGWTHSSTGALPNGSNTYADTFLIPSTSLTISSGHLSIYSRTDIGDRYDMGSNSSATGGGEISLISRWNDNKFYVNYGASTFPSVTNTDSRGHFITNRNSTTNTTGFKNGVKVIDIAQISNLSTLKMFLGAVNSNNVTADYSLREYSFSSIGDGLSDTEAANLYTAVQNFNTTLSRQV